MTFADKITEYYGAALLRCEAGATDPLHDAP